MKAFKNISFLILASFYLTTACAITVNAVIDALPSSGAKAIVAHNGHSKEIPAKLTIQRRHMPLAKDIPCPSVHIGTTEFPPIVEQRCIAARFQIVQFSHAYSFSSFSDRAPPVA